jgi:hypothetical protein
MNPLADSRRRDSLLIRYPWESRLARKSHPTNARLGGQSDRHVSGVAGMLAGGASRRAEYWNLLRCRRSEESVSVGLGMTPRE